MFISLRRPRSGQIVPVRYAKVVKIAGVRQALFVPHADGWYVYHVGSSRTGMAVNGRATVASSLNVGDVVQINDNSFVVDELDTDGAPTFEPGETSTRCRVEAEGRAETLTAGTFLIGSAAHCDMRFDDQSGKAPLWALIAPLGRRWLLYDLLAEPNRTPQIWTPLRDGDEFVVGPVRVAFEIIADYELSGSKPTLPPLFPPPETVSGVSVSDLFDTTPHTSNGPGRDPDPNEPPERAYARNLLAWVGGVYKSPPGRTPLPLPNDPISLGPTGPTAPDDVAKRLAERPRDRKTLLDLTRWCRDRQWDDLYRVGLRRLVHADPADAPIAIALVRAYLDAGRNHEKPPAERGKCLDEAARFLGAQVALAARGPNLTRWPNPSMSNGRFSIFPGPRGCHE